MLQVCVCTCVAGVCTGAAAVAGVRAVDTGHGAGGADPVLVTPTHARLDILVIDTLSLVCTTYKKQLFHCGTVKLSNCDPVVVV